MEGLGGWCWREGWRTFLEIEVVLMKAQRGGLQWSGVSEGGGGLSLVSVGCPVARPAAPSYLILLQSSLAGREDRPRDLS